MNKRTYRPLVIATVIWVLITFVWTPLWLGYIGRILVQIFDNSQSQFWIALGSFLGTNLGEVVFPLGLYFFVVKPYVKTPIINTRSSNRYRLVVLTILIIGTYFLIVPRLTYEYQVSSHLIMGATFIGVGLSEEWSDRGVLTRVFKDRFGIVWAIVIVSLMFALSHWAEVMIVDRQQIFTTGWLLHIADDLVFAVVLSVIAWRSASITWVAFLHFLLDWQPWLYGIPNWMTHINFPFLGNGIVIYAIGIMGAEIIRAFTKGVHSETQVSETAM